MPAAELRFLPWTRSGLAAVLPNPDGGSPPAHPTVTVGLTVTNAGAGSVPLELYGPGDIVGVDPRLIVRTERARRSTS